MVEYDFGPVLGMFMGSRLAVFALRKGNLPTRRIFTWVIDTRRHAVLDCPGPNVAPALAHYHASPQKAMTLLGNESST